MPWDRWEEQSVYFCEVVCRDVLLPAVASHNIAASSTQGIYGSRARLCPLGSGAPTRCHTDPPLQDVLMTPHFLSPHSSRGSPEVGLSLLPPLQAARWPADEEELELSGDRERRGEKLGERKLEMTKR